MLYSGGHSGERGLIYRVLNALYLLAFCSGTMMYCYFGTSLLTVKIPRYPSSLLAGICGIHYERQRSWPLEYGLYAQELVSAERR